MPWRLPSEMKAFRAATMGKPVLMGRKTWASLAVRPLPGRANFVLTRDCAFRAEGARVFSDPIAMIAAGLAAAEACGAEEACIIGGAEFYALALPYADRVRITDIDLDVEGDAYFPTLRPEEWREFSREDLPAGPKGQAGFIVRQLERRSVKQRRSW